MVKLLTCAKAPCKSCPYRKDVPSGVWAEEEYLKLPDYDGDIIDQAMKGAMARFDCHQRDGNLCAGWVGHRGAFALLAMRVLQHKVDPDIWDYKSPVPLFKSGQQACDHGMKAMIRPGRNARQMIDRLKRKRDRDGNW